MQELTAVEIEEVNGGVIFLVLGLAVSGEALAAGVLSAGVAALATFQYLRS